LAEQCGILPRVSPVLPALQVLEEILATLEQPAEPVLLAELAQQVLEVILATRVQLDIKAPLAEQEKLV
jgi:hypothetical protein